MKQKQKKKIARLHAHIARQRKDYLHKESRKITNFYDLVCIESLNMKEMSQDMCFGKRVHDNGWGMFTDFLAYKMERAGKRKNGVPYGEIYTYCESQRVLQSLAG